VADRVLLDVDALLGRHPRRDVGPGTVAALLSTMDRVGITEAVVGHTMSWLHDPAAGNRQLLKEIAGQPRLRPCWVMLPDGTNEVGTPDEFVGDAMLSGVAAIRAYPGDHGYDLAGPDTAGMLDAIAAAGLPMLVDSTQTSWPQIETAARDRPTLKIIVCQPGYRTLRRIAGVFERTDNVYLDLANFSSHCGVEWLVDRFGAERLLFGTAYPDHDPAEAVTRLLWSELDDDAVTAIGSENAEKLLGATA
jgi:amidohydrolase family protein